MNTQRGFQIIYMVIYFKQNKFDMPALSVPNLTRPNQYPSGKSATSDNWRTRARADEVAIAEQQLAEVMVFYKDFDWNLLTL